MPDEALPRRKRGGQPKPAAERKRNNLTFRVRDNLRAQLQASADQHQRSLSEECEYRLEHSFAVEQRFRDLDEYEEKAKRLSRIRHGLEPPPGKFISEEEAAKPFQPGPIVPPALKDAMKDAAREVLAEQGIKDAIREALAEIGIIGQKGAT
jgi:hypothetical protein